MVLTDFSQVLYLRHKICFKEKAQGFMITYAEEFFTTEQELFSRIIFELNFNSVQKRA